MREKPFGHLVLAVRAMLWSTYYELRVSLVETVCSSATSSCATPFPACEAMASSPGTSPSPYSYSYSSYAPSTRGSMRSSRGSSRTSRSLLRTHGRLRRLWEIELGTGHHLAQPRKGRWVRGFLLARPRHDFAERLPDSSSTRERASAPSSRSTSAWTHHTSHTRLEASPSGSTRASGRPSRASPRDDGRTTCTPGAGEGSNLNTACRSCI